MSVYSPRRYCSKKVYIEKPEVFMRVNRNENTKPEVFLLNFGTSTNVYQQFTMMLTSLPSSSVLSTSPW